MRIRHGIIITLACVAGVACDKAADSTPEPTTSSATPVTSTSAQAKKGKRGKRGKRRHGGRKAMMGARGGRGFGTMMVRTALKKLTLTDEQKTTLSALRKPSPSANGDAHKAYRTALAEGVKTNQLDAAKFEVHFKAMETAEETKRTADAKRLNDLHAALDATQRKELVAAVRARKAARAQKPPKGAQEKGPDAKSDRRTDRLVKQLGLDEKQATALKALHAKDTRPTAAERTTKREAHAKKLDAVLTAFEQDSFDATKLDLGGDKKSRRERATKHLARLKSMVAILNEDQRAKFAKRFERGPTEMRMRGRGGPRGRRLPRRAGDHPGYDEVPTFEDELPAEYDDADAPQE